MDPLPKMPSDAEHALLTIVAFALGVLWAAAALAGSLFWGLVISAVFARIVARKDRRDV